MIPRLLSLGFFVRGFDLFETADTLRGVEYVFDDIDKSTVISRIARDIDHVFHLQNLSGPGLLTARKTGDTLKAHLTSTIKLANVAKSLGTKTFVYVSSAQVYGPSREELYRESEKPRPVSRTGRRHLAVERYLVETMVPRNLTVIILRIPPVTGWGIPPAAHPSLHASFRRAFFGKSIPLIGSGKHPVQYLDVEDLVSAMVRGIKTNTKGLLTLNVAADDIITQRELFDFLVEFAESPSRPLFLPAPLTPLTGLLGRMGIPPLGTDAHILHHPQTIIDATRARDYLEFTPKRTTETLSEMFRSWVDGMPMGDRAGTHVSIFRR
ncbi:MAG: NAD(P)-dependent oxidoreductase [Deltaproteobacteria bacterium]|nr:NAD(P)-dependent oxidoreductase [Candidatus Zymogenaceae bacterium]